MNEQRIFADVDLPFHVWVREGRRWVLRDAAPRLAHREPEAPRPPRERNAASRKARGPRD